MGENVIARRQRLEDRHGGAASGSKSRRGRSAFQRADTLFKRLAIGIVVARIHEPARISAIDVALERGGKINRRGDRPSRRIDGMACVDRHSFNFHFDRRYKVKRNCRSCLLIDSWARAPSNGLDLTPGQRKRKYQTALALNSAFP